MIHHTLAFEVPFPTNIYGLIAFLGVLALIGFVMWLFFRNF